MKNEWLYNVQEKLVDYALFCQKIIIIIIITDKKHMLFLAKVTKLLLMILNCENSSNMASQWPLWILKMSSIRRAAKRTILIALIQSIH